MALEAWNQFDCLPSFISPKYPLADSNFRRSKCQGWKQVCQSFTYKKSVSWRLLPHGTLFRDSHLNQKEKIPKETNLLSHSRFVKDSPWDKSRGSCSHVKVKLGPASSLNFLLISPSLCISIKRIFQILNLIKSLMLLLQSHNVHRTEHAEGKKVKIEQSPLCFHK